ncbi:YceI family protein [Rhodococcus sp. HNM0569]|uniref:YceI family protein n=1 Tax=Rhodococcus sp. HNM0569 TaxID=2716340 RepID=UPI00146C8FD9|nr:YceI family protein [Rhodococcus sp. HNM0569]NLU83515.1 YceI family protein [Rhodococcus sp. HNM0569]
MSRLWWLIGAVVAVLAVAVVGPWAYDEYVAGEDDSAFTLSDPATELPANAPPGSWPVTHGTGIDQTAAGYTVHETLVGAQSTVSGSTGEVTGWALVNGDIVRNGEVHVKVSGIRTDSAQRDEYFANTLMRAPDFPDALFALVEPVDISSVPADGALGTVTTRGELTLKGQTVPVTVNMQVRKEPAGLIVAANVPVWWRDFGIEPPSLGFVSVAPNGTLDFVVNFARR